MTNMSDGLSTAVPLAALSRGFGFRPDARFGLTSAAPGVDPLNIEDQITEAYSRGYDAGISHAREEAGAQAQADRASREAIIPALQRIDRDMYDALSRHLRDIVVALCEEAMAPYALDPLALCRRITAALDLLRDDATCTVRLNPDDIAALSGLAEAGWTILPDPLLERGTVRVEGADGGVEDGPAQWRARIGEALNAC